MVVDAKRGPRTGGIAPSGRTYEQIRELSTDTHKHCSSCDDFKPLTDFTTQIKGLRGRVSECRLCCAIRNRAHRTKPEVQARYRIWMAERRYGPEAVPAQERIEAGEGCVVCGGNDIMHLDHDHETGKFRDILCHHCNTALGQVGDSIERLEALIAYLRKHGKTT